MHTHHDFTVKVYAIHTTDRRNTQIKAIHINSKSYWIQWKTSSAVYYSILWITFLVNRQQNRMKQNKSNMRKTSYVHHGWYYIRSRWTKKKDRKQPWNVYSYFNVENVFFWFLILCSISADAYICICVRLCEKNEFKRQNQILNWYEFAVLYWNRLILRCIQRIDNLGSSCRLHIFIYFINVYRFFSLSLHTKNTFEIEIIFIEIVQRAIYTLKLYRLIHHFDCRVHAFFFFAWMMMIIREYCVHVSYILTKYIPVPFHFYLHQSNWYLLLFGWTTISFSLSFCLYQFYAERVKYFLIFNFQYTIMLKCDFTFIFIYVIKSSAT